LYLRQQLNKYFYGPVFGNVWHRRLRRTLERSSFMAATKGIILVIIQKKCAGITTISYSKLTNV